MAVDDIVGIRIVGRYQEQNIVSTLHYEIAAQTASEEIVLLTLCTAWEDAFGTAWAARHIDSYTLVGLKGFSKSGVNKVPGILEVGTAGIVAGIEAPSCVQRVITLYTASENYRRRGRVNLSGCDTAMFNETDGAVTETERTALGAIGTLLIAPLVSGDDSFTPVLPPTDLLTKENLTAALPRKTPGILRSRRVRGFSVG